MYSASFINQGAQDVYWTLKRQEDLIILLGYHTASWKLGV